MSVTNLLNTGGISLARTEQIVDELGQAEGIYINPFPYLIFSSNNSFGMVIPSEDRNWDGTLEYCLSDPDDSLNWYEWDGSIIYSINNKIYLRGTNNTIISGQNALGHGCFSFYGSNINCNGNIENLLDYRIVLQGNHPTMGSYCFAYLFFGCENLIAAPALPSLNLRQGCYLGMFGSTGLITAPALPATSLSVACYQYMFGSCRNLINAPALPALVLNEEGEGMGAYNCYLEMFENCISLTRAPALPATVLSQACYASMFMNCYNLTVLPSLRALNIPIGAYEGMFQGCTKIKLSAAQEGEYQNSYRIPVTGEGTSGLDAVNSMFSGTGGTITAININTTYYTSNTIIDPS